MRETKTYLLLHNQEREHQEVNVDRTVWLDYENVFLLAFEHSFAGDALFECCEASIGVRGGTELRNILSVS
jgi:hypothetical protein